MRLAPYGVPVLGGVPVLAALVLMAVPAAFVLVAVPAAFVLVAFGVALVVVVFGVTLAWAVFVAFAFELLLLLQPTPTREPIRIAPVPAPSNQFFAFMALPPYSVAREG